VNPDNIPSFHDDPWVNLLRPYVSRAVAALACGGVYVEDSWLDPRDPRDATIVYSLPHEAGLRAAVWDEVTGWRHGLFLGGHQGIRTTLSGTEYLGGGMLPPARELMGRLRDGSSEPRCEYRSVDHLRDGLDDLLRSTGG
jgi:Family of unknown function (DUF6292)